MARICEVCGRREESEDTYDLYDVCESCAEDRRQPYDDEIF